MNMDSFVKLRWSLSGLRLFQGNLIGTLALLLLFWVPASAQDRETLAKSAYTAAYEKVLDQDWHEVRSACSRLLQDFPESVWTDDGYFWICYAEERLGTPRVDSFECFEQLVASYPDSEWADDARRNLVRLGEALAQEGYGSYRDRVELLGEAAEATENLEVLVALGQLDDPQSVNVVLRKIDRTDDPVLRARMVGSLENVDSEEVIGTLRLLVENDPATEVRLTALETLGDLGETTSGYLVQVAGDSRQLGELRQVALDELSDDPASPELLRTLRQIVVEEAEGPIVAAAAEVLGDLSDPIALEILDAGLRVERDPAVRGVSLTAVAEYESKEATEILLRAITEAPRDESSLLAAVLLAEHKSSEALAALEALVQPEFPLPLRLAALEGLSDFESKAASEAIAGVLKNGHERELVVAAIRAAGRNGHNAGIDGLVEVALASEDSETVDLVIDALEDIGGPMAREAIRSLAQR